MIEDKKEQPNSTQQTSLISEKMKDKNNQTAIKSKESTESVEFTELKKDLEYLQFFGFLPKNLLSSLQQNLIKLLKEELSKLPTFCLNYVFPEIYNSFLENYGIFKAYSLKFIFKDIFEEFSDGNNLLYGRDCFDKKIDYNLVNKIIEEYEFKRKENINKQIELNEIKNLNEEIEKILEMKEKFHKTISYLNKYDEMIFNLEKNRKIFTKNEFLTEEVKEKYCEMYSERRGEEIGDLNDFIEKFI